MKKVGTIKKYNIYQLDRDTALTHAKDLAALANTIPMVEYSEEKILAGSKQERIFHAKWDHSLTVFDGKKPIALVLAYERESENNNLYPENCFYVSELAVDSNYQRQGIARSLLAQWMELNKKFLYLNGQVVYGIQTNAAEWNKHVADLYLSLGFKKIGVKQYDDHIDSIFKLRPKNSIKKSS